MIMLCFTCCVRKIWQSIKRSQNIMTMVVDYKSARGKTYNFSKCLLPIAFFKKYIPKRFIIQRCG